MEGKTLLPKIVNKTMVKQLAEHIAICHQHQLIMPDLRWDQFLTDGKKITALVDLDALISGSIELEFVILEYLLTNQQADWFLVEYSKTAMPPKIFKIREKYRTLLSNMNILGCKDHKKWLQQPIIFN